MKLTQVSSHKSTKLRIISFMMIALFFHSAILTAQTTRITLSVRNVSLKEFLTEVGAKGNVFFSYKDVVLNPKKDITFTANNESIESILTRVLDPKGLMFTITGSTIAIKSKPIDQSSKGSAKKISGLVVDDKGEPVIGANVSVKGTTVGAITDIDGKFTLDVVQGQTLVVSYIGYSPKEIAISDQTSYNISIAEDMQKLEEVVVVGYGTQKKVNLTGSVSVLNSEEIGRKHVSQTSMALQGLMPGVVVSQRNGQPGNDGGSISIRGITTLNNDGILVLVDGVEMGINNIDPTMIESISVLKDAASSAIYGSRAANGVILITTKRAHENTLSISYDSYVSWQAATDLPKMVGAIDHMNLINEAYVNAGSSQLYSDIYIKEYMAGMESNPDRYPDTNWYDKVLTGNGFMHNHSLTLSGGTNKVKFLTNLGYLNQNGIIQNTNFERYSFKVNSDYKFNEYLSAQADVSLIQTVTKEPSKGTSQAIHDAGRIPANQPAVFSNGQWGEGWNGSNPVAFTQSGGLHNLKKPVATLNLSVRYQPLKWLSMELAYSPKLWESHSSTFVRAIQTYTWDGKPSYLAPQKSTLDVSNTHYLQNNLKYMVNAEKKFEDNHFKLLLGYQQENYMEEFLNGYREVFTFDQYPYLNAGEEANQKAYGKAEEWALRSFFSRLNYSYKERYLAEANFRYDGSSRFSKGRKWGLFPSFSLGWRISEEEFFSRLKEAVNNLKIRASWGQLGNQNIGTYPSISTVTLGLSYPFDGKIANGAGITNMANSEISWETTTVTNIGLDVSIFNKIHITAEYYYKKTNDILMRLDIPKILGVSAPYQNVGVVENKGWDINVNYVNRDNPVKFNVGLNISDVQNRILDLKGVSQTGITVNQEGYSMNSIYGLVAERYISENDFDPNGKYKYSTQFGNFKPGDIKYMERSGDNTINEKDYAVIGSTIPRYSFGVNFNSEYKNFDLSILIQGVGQADGLIHSQGIMPFYVGGTIQEQHKDRWTTENRDSKFPRLAFNETNNTKISSFWMKNAAYIRMKDIQLGYTLPKNTVRKILLSDVRFYISGQNLFTVSEFWKGYDVEAPVGNGGYYPQQKTFLIGCNVKF